MDKLVKLRNGQWTTGEEVAYREFEIETRAIDEDARTVDLAFSSEEPVETWFGLEILDHGQGSIRMKRIKRKGPLLLEHRSSDQIGVVESVVVGSDRVARAKVRFGKSAHAEEIWQDVRDGIRSHVSVGYMRHAMVIEAEEDDQRTYRVVDWEPFEVSIVSCPADITVGVGRSKVAADRGKEEFTMEEDPKKPPVVPAEPSAAAIDAARAAERKSERERAVEIDAMSKRFAPKLKDIDSMATKAKVDGWSVDQFRAAVLDEMSKEPLPKAAPLGLTPDETQQFSIMRAVQACANPTDRRAQEAAAFEFDVSRAWAAKRGRDARSFFVPPDVLRAEAVARGRRDMNVGTGSAGGYLVSDVLLSFVEMLENASIALPRATVFADVKDQVSLVRETAGATGYWVAEGAAPTESAPTMDRLTLAAKTVAGYIDLTRQMMVQSPMSVEDYARRTLATKIGLAIDLAVFHGSGVASQPLGIINTTGVGVVGPDTHGAALSLANVVDLETEVSQDNALLGDLGYATNNKVVGKGKKTFTNTTYGSERIITMRADGTPEVNGYPIHMSNQIKSDLTQGSGTALSALFFGNFRDIAIALWSGVDILVDPFSQSSTGITRVTGFQDADLGLMHTSSWAVKKDIITT